MFNSEFLQILNDRGFIHQCTDEQELDSLLSKQVISAYIGFDATADSLHVGSLLPIMMLRHLQKSGHKPIIVMGGGTTKIGDPSGKDKSRQLLTHEDIEKNIESLKTIFSQFLTFGDGPTDAIMVNNDEWLSELKYVDFLRDYGVHFTINRMMTFDSVKLRLDREQPLTFLEFNYMICQAYDYLELSNRFDCRLQMGGSDQWGNIINGTELTRRVNGKDLFGLTCPLLTTSSGAKMGKSESGAIWLNEKNLSHYDYWQYWRNTEDADVIKFLKLFTEMPLEEIEKLAKLEGSELNTVKKILATEATKLCRGEDAALQAQKTAEELFEKGQLSQDLPTIEIAKADLQEGILAYELLKIAGYCQSNGEARRLIKGSGARLNDKVIQDDSLKVTLEHCNEDNLIKVSKGKKHHTLIKPT